jgi:hypothetical protein
VESIIACHARASVVVRTLATNASFAVAAETNVERAASLLQMVTIHAFAFIQRSCAKRRSITAEWAIETFRIVFTLISTIRARFTADILASGFQVIVVARTWIAFHAFVVLDAKTVSTNDRIASRVGTRSDRPGLVF